MTAPSTNLLNRPDQALTALRPRDLLSAAPGGAATQSPLERNAQLLVSQTFFGTLLKQMRQSPFRSELFDGGRGGQAFGSLYDQHLAQRMAQGAGRKLVRAIVRKIEAKHAYAGQSTRTARTGQPAAKPGTRSPG